MRKLRGEEQAELDTLYRETVALIDWFTTYQGFSYGPQVKQALDKAKTANKLGAMRTIAREIRGYTSALPPEIRAQITEAVRLESGISVAPSELLDTVSAEAIVKRGSILNEEEYYLLRQHTEGVANGAQSSVPLAALEELLDSYHP